MASGTPFYLILRFVNPGAGGFGDYRGVAQCCDWPVQCVRSGHERVSFSVRVSSLIIQSGVLTTSGVTALQLSGVPLGIGAVAPAAARGTSVTIRGNGFQPGTKASLGSKALTVIFKATILSHSRCRHSLPARNSRGSRIPTARAFRQTRRSSRNNLL